MRGGLSIVGGQDPSKTGPVPPSRVSAGTGRRPSDLSIVCVSSVPWSSMRQRPQQIMGRYSRHAKVLYVEPPRRPGHHVMTGALTPRLRRESEHLWSLSPQKAFPFDRLMPPLRALNEFATRRIVGSALERLGFGGSAIWFYYLNSFRPVRLRGTGMVVYDCVDDLSGFWQPYGDIVARENRLARMSDVVFAVSSRLRESMSRLNPNTFLVPNGVDYQHFSSTLPRESPPQRMMTLGRPILGFSGAIYDWVDLELLATLARRRRDWTFVLVGPVGADIQVPRLENMLLLGEVEYESLPQYLAAFDVCLLPFKRQSLTESADPIKLYEYLAAGRPIVSTGIPEARRFAELIEIADDVEGFEKAIARALESDTPEKLRERQDMARRNSWDARVDAIREILASRREDIGV